MELGEAEVVANGEADGAKRAQVGEDGRERQATEDARGFTGAGDTRRR